MKQRESKVFIPVKWRDSCISHHRLPDFLILHVGGGDTFLVGTMIMNRRIIIKFLSHLTTMMITQTITQIITQIITLAILQGVVFVQGGVFTTM